MKIMKIIGNIFGRGLRRKNRLQQIRMTRQHNTCLRQIENAQKKARALKWPQIKMTREEFQLLNEQKIDLKNCPLRTWFVYKKPLAYLPGVIVVGQVVAGGDMFADQWGAGLSVPDRGANKYRLEVV